MKIKTKVTFRQGGKDLPKGSVIAMEDVRAQAFIRAGKAEQVIDTPALDLTDAAATEEKDKGKKAKNKE